MIITNPTKEECEVQYEGVWYEIGAYEEKEVPDDVGNYWLKKVHKFLRRVNEDGQEEEVELTEEDVEEALENAIEAEEAEPMEESDDPEVLKDEYTRDQLDVKAEDLGLDPLDYQNKTEISQAIIDNR